MFLDGWKVSGREIRHDHCVYRLANYVIEYTDGGAPHCYGCGKGVPKTILDVALLSGAAPVLQEEHKKEKVL